MLYMGVGGAWSPHCPLIDIVISDRLAAKGFSGTRDETVCLYGTNILDQALDYARDRSIDHVKCLEPQDGAVLAWFPGIRDALLAFQDHLSDMTFVGMQEFNGVEFGALLWDVRGDLDILETYLRQVTDRRPIDAVMDNFLHHHVAVEHVYRSGDDMLQLLSGHQGEVWITGPCVVTDYVPGIAEHNTPIPLSS